MTSKKLAIFITVVALFFSIVGIAKATFIVGIATKGETLVEAGNYDGDRIRFFIPIDGSQGEGTYGVGDYGMTRDTFQVGEEQIQGPLETMFLYFSVDPGEFGHTLTLTLTDGDLEPYNDPGGFFEKLTLNGEYGLPDETYGEYGTLDVLDNVVVVNNDSSTNNDISIIFTGLNVPSGENWIKLGFQAYSVGLRSGLWTNTEEKLLAVLETSPVPEPASIVLISLGLLGFAGFRRKFRKR